MNRREAAILRNVDRQRAARAEARKHDGLCPRCGEKVYHVGPYMICRNLQCERLVTNAG